MEKGKSLSDFGDFDRYLCAWVTRHATYRFLPPFFQHTSFSAGKLRVAILSKARQPEGQILGMASHANGETLSRRAVNHRAVAASVNLLSAVALFPLWSDRELLWPLMPAWGPFWPVTGISTPTGHSEALPTTLQGNPPFPK